MLDLIKEIDHAWENNLTIYGIVPCRKLGYLRFRNNIIQLHKGDL